MVGHGLESGISAASVPRWLCAAAGTTACLRLSLGAFGAHFDELICLGRSLAKAVRCDLDRHEASRLPPLSTQKRLPRSRRQPLRPEVSNDCARPYAITWRIRAAKAAAYLQNILRGCASWKDDGALISLWLALLEGRSPLFTSLRMRVRLRFACAFCPLLPGAELEAD